MMIDWNESWFCGPGSFVHGPWGMLVNMAFWLIMIFLAVQLYQMFATRRPAAPASPLDILKRRYASGEIDREEFESRKGDLL